MPLSREELILVGPHQTSSGAHAGGASPSVSLAAPSHSEPTQMIDFAEVAERYHCATCGLLVRDPHTLFVYWEVTEETITEARAQLGASGGAAVLVLRVFADLVDVPPAEARVVRDHDLGAWHVGRRYFASPRPGALVRAAVGLLSREGYFAPIAHSPAQRVPPDGPAPMVSEQWITVAPALERGRVREPLVITHAPLHDERGVLVRLASRFGAHGGSSSSGAK